MGHITSYVPGDENYDKIAQTIQPQGTAKSAATERYNEISEAYNQLPIHGYLSLHWQGIRMSNLEKVLFNRGIVRDRDYTLSRSAVDLEGKKLHRDDRPVLIQRFTETAMRVV